jgi:hypothetical protein
MRLGFKDEMLFLHINIFSRKGVCGSVVIISTYLAGITLTLTPKGRSPFFDTFLEFGQAIVDAIFVQKISNFW